MVMKALAYLGELGLTKEHFHLISVFEVKSIPYEEINVYCLQAVLSSIN